MHLVNPANTEEAPDVMQTAFKRRATILMIIFSTSQR